MVKRLGWRLITAGSILCVAFFTWRTWTSAVADNIWLRLLVTAVFMYIAGMLVWTVKVMERQCY